jgi:hypothetical protein
MYRLSVCLSVPFILYFIFLIRSTQTIVAEVPQFSSVMPNMPWAQRPISTPLSLVRRDGVVYLTPLVFTYTPQPAAPRKSSPSLEATLPPTSDNNFCE